MVNMLAIIAVSAFMTFIAVKIGYALGERSNRKEDERDADKMD